MLSRSCQTALQQNEWIGILIARLSVGMLFALSGSGKLFASSRRDAMFSTLVAARGGVWVGYTRGRASFISSDGRVVNYSEQEGLPVSKVRSFARTPDGAVWAAVIGGLARFDGTGWQKVSMDWNYPCKSAWRVFVDRQGTLWVGSPSPDGVYFLPKGTRRFEDTGLKNAPECWASRKPRTARCL